MGWEVVGGEENGERLETRSLRLLGLQLSCFGIRVPGFQVVVLSKLDRSVYVSCQVYLFSGLKVAISCASARTG